jgi:hypothetical protein
VGGFGYKMHPSPDPKWDKKYWKLRNEIDNLESTLTPEDRREK